MSMWKKVLLFLLAVLVAVVVGIYIFLGVNGRRLFNEQVSSLTNRKVTVQVIAPKLPIGVVLKGVAVEGLLSVQRVQVMIDPMALLAGRVKITSALLERPVLFLERGVDARLTLPHSKQGAVPSAESSSAMTVAAPAKSISGTVIIHSLSVFGGEVHLKDEKSGREWIVSDIQGVVREIPLTGDPATTEFRLTASLAKLDVPVVGQTLRLQGWLNWAAKDMDGAAQVVDDNGLTGLDVKLMSKANDLHVKGHLRMSPRRKKDLPGRKSGMAENVVLGVLGILANDIDADFSFRTAMDRFEIGEIAFRGKAESKLNSGKTLGSIVDEMRSVGEELLKKDVPAGK